MFGRATFLALVAIVGLMAATPADTAVIVNSGSTNSYGYTIHVASDGKASFTLQKRGESAATTPKPFTVPATTATRFFSDLAAARKTNAATAALHEECVVRYDDARHVARLGLARLELSVERRIRRCTRARHHGYPSGRGYPGDAVSIRQRDPNNDYSVSSANPDGGRLSKNSLRKLRADRCECARRLPEVKAIADALRTAV